MIFFVLMSEEIQFLIQGFHFFVMYKFSRVKIRF